jgi:hypothetical protein
MKLPSSFVPYVYPSQETEDFISNGEAWAGLAGVMLRWFRPGQIAPVKNVSTTYEEVVSTLATHFGVADIAVDNTYESLADWIADVYDADATPIVMGCEWLRGRRRPRATWTGVADTPAKIKNRNLVAAYMLSLPVSLPVGFSVSYDDEAGAVVVSTPVESGRLTLPHGWDSDVFTRLVTSPGPQQMSYQVFGDFLAVQELVYSALTGTLVKVGGRYQVTVVDRFSLLISHYLQASHRLLIAPWET